MWIVTEDVLLNVNKIESFQVLHPDVNRGNVVCKTNTQEWIDLTRGMPIKECYRALKHIAKEINLHADDFTYVSDLSDL